jgi:Raf kinase inhibitor-like YbhB/YbcL family protein
MLRLCFTLLMSGFLIGCGSGGDRGQTKGESSMEKLTLESSAFESGAPIPDRHTCDAEGLSPPLAWGAAPEGTQSWALICDDPDAPMGTWVHWVLFNLPAEARELPEGVPTSGDLETGGRHGKNDFARLGYGGPCPPHGKPHRYFFKLYALNTSLSLDPGATKSDVLNAMEGHVVAQGELMGTYVRR